MRRLIWNCKLSRLNLIGGCERADRGREAVITRDPSGGTCSDAAAIQTKGALGRAPAMIAPVLSSVTVTRSPRHSGKYEFQVCRGLVAPYRLMAIKVKTVSHRQRPKHDIAQVVPSDVKGSNQCSHSSALALKYGSFNPKRRCATT